MFKQRYTARKKYDLLKMGSLELKAAAPSAADTYIVSAQQQRPSSSVANSEDSDEDMMMNRYLRMESPQITALNSSSDNNAIIATSVSDNLPSSTTATISASTSFSFPPKYINNDNAVVLSANDNAAAVNNSVNSSLVPTISVTPYSPMSPAATTVGKHYVMLEDNLRQLHDIVDSVQQMKDDNTAILYANSRNLYSNEQPIIGGAVIRLSCSCPSLNDQDSDSEMQNNSFNSSPSYKDASTSLSTSHFSTAPPPVGAAASRRQRASCDWASSGTANVLNALSDETLRRKSWSALEDLSSSSSHHHHQQHQQFRCNMTNNSGIGRGAISPYLMDRRRSSAAAAIRKQQRSVSVSSLDSDFVEDPFTDSAVNLLSAIDSALAATSALERRRKSTTTTTTIGTPRKSRNCDSGGAAGNNNSSTRSLNEADLQKDFDKLKAIKKQQRDDEMDLMMISSLQQTARLLPLQKSISTPSILSVKDGGTICAAATPSSKDAKQLLSSSGKLENCVAASSIAHPSGTESETEEEILASLLDAGTSPAINRASLLSYIQDGVYATRQEKRQKRGSLFFRRKKDLPASGAAATTASTSGGTGNNVKTVGSNSKKSAGQVSFQNSGLPNDHVSQFHFHHDGYSDETPLVPLEFLNENMITYSDLDTDPFLGLQDDEPETWSMTVNKELVKKMKEKDVKRQEHIYELILTEKHHCLTLRVMQKIFVDGLQKYFSLGANLNRMFPRLSDLTDIHLKFLYTLRVRQREAPIVQNIGDILLELFSGDSADKLKSAYGEFCSRHRDAVNIYKHHLQHDSNFAVFVKHCQNNPLLKKKGIPECILFVTQRLTKYPLLIEPLIKTSKEMPDELNRLTRSLSLVKEILVTVDSKVEEKEKEEKKFEIYNKIDSKSFTHYKGKKFKKSSVLSNNRKLQFEGAAMLMQGRTKMQMVHVIVLTDILFFLTENNNKFTFVTPYGKEGVISLQRLLIREKAGSDSRGLYLISSTLPNPEMYELKIHKPKEKQVWIRSIRDVIRLCPSTDDGDYYRAVGDSSGPGEEKSHNSTEEQQHVYLHQIIESLRQKDLEQAITLEEKIALQMKLLVADGVKLSMETPSYGRLLSNEVDWETVNKEIVYVLQRVGELTSSFYNTETSLSRSASSVGERQSVAYISPILPKRAETFGGFDNANKEQPIIATRNGANRKLSQQLPRKSSDNLSSHSHLAVEPLKKLSFTNFLEEQQLSWKHVLNMVGASFNTGSANNNNNSNSNNNHGISSNVNSIAQNIKTSSNVSLSSQQQPQQQLPLLLQVDKTVQPILIELTSHMYTLTTVIMKQTTVMEDLQVRLKILKDEHDQQYQSASGADSLLKKDKKLASFNHSQQLEELRNLQDKLTQEREQWQQRKDAEEKDLDEKRQQLLRLQEQIRNEQNDVTLQREQLYRKLELLTSQGMHINSDIVPPAASTGSSTPASSSSAVGISTSPLPDQQQQQQSSSSPSSCDMSSKRRSDSMRWKQTMSNKTAAASTLPLNLISATNQQKVSSTNVHIKQKLPLKLASKLGSNVTSGGGSSSSSSSLSSFSVSNNSTPTSSLASPVQQIIPLKLQQGVAAFTNNNCVGSASSGESIKYASPLTCSIGYQRLPSSVMDVAASCSPSHSRTGSSPAMMQNTDMTTPTELKDYSSSSRSAERTNTYPKISDRYKVQSPPHSLVSTSNTNNNNNITNARKSKAATDEEEVIFF